MTIQISRALAATALLLLVAACSSGRQQPSEVVNDRASDSPSRGGSTSDAGLDNLGSGTDPIVTGSTPAGDLPINGNWASNPSACGDETAMVVIAETTLERPGKTCEVADRLDSGNHSLTMTLTCPAGLEGETESDLVKLTPDGDSLILSVVGGDEAPLTLSRCP